MTDTYEFPKCTECGATVQAPAFIDGKPYCVPCAVPRLAAGSAGMVNATLKLYEHCEMVKKNRDAAFDMLTKVEAKLVLAQKERDDWKAIVEDDCETEQLVKISARRVLTEFQVSGDTYGVPGEVDIVDSLVDMILATRKERDEAQAACAATRVAAERTIAELRKELEAVTQEELNQRAYTEGAEDALEAERTAHADTRRQLEVTKRDANAMNEIVRAKTGMGQGEIDHLAYCIDNFEAMQKERDEAQAAIQRLTDENKRLREALKWTYNAWLTVSSEGLKGRGYETDFVIPDDTSANDAIREVIDNSASTAKDAGTAYAYFEKAEPLLPREIPDGEPFSEKDAKIAALLSAAERIERARPLKGDQPNQAYWIELWDSLEALREAHAAYLASLPAEFFTR